MPHANYVHFTQRLSASDSGAFFLSRADQGSIGKIKIVAAGARSMNPLLHFISILTFLMAVGSTNHTAFAFQDTSGQDIFLIQEWSGDFPVAKLNLLPESQRDSSCGFLDTTDFFVPVWHAFKPSEAVPKVDFTKNLVLFSRNIAFYNSTKIVKLELKSGVAKIMAMETMSARPIEKSVAMSMAVFPRDGIIAIQAGDKQIPVAKQSRKNRVVMP